MFGNFLENCLHQWWENLERVRHDPCIKAEPNAIHRTSLPLSIEIGWIALHCFFYVELWLQKKKSLEKCFLFCLPWFVCFSSEFNFFFVYFSYVSISHEMYHTFNFPSSIFYIILLTFNSPGKLPKGKVRKTKSTVKTVHGKMIFSSWAGEGRKNWITNRNMVGLQQAPLTCTQNISNDSVKRWITRPEHISCLSFFIIISMLKNKFIYILSVVWCFFSWFSIFSINRLALLMLLFATANDMVQIGMKHESKREWDSGRIKTKQHIEIDDCAKERM